MSAGLQTTHANVGTTLASLAADLRKGGLSESRLVAEWLVAEALRCPRLELPVRMDHEVPAEARGRLHAWAQRLIEGEPLQYVLGYTEFMGLRLRSDPRALIPRPETEGLVEKALEFAEQSGGDRVRVADVGTGTGCIAVALAVHLPGARVQALDVSRQALELAAENIAEHGMGDRVALAESNGLSGTGDGSLDLVVSNPPYVTTEEWAGLPDHIRLHEPVSALEAGEDGLAVIRRLAPQAVRALRPGGRLLLEIGEQQGPAVAALLSDAGFIGVEVARDLAGHDRYVKGDTPCSNR